MLAEAIEGAVWAKCLSKHGPLAGKYVCGSQDCGAWKSGHYGAVDDPPDAGATVRRLYAEDEGGEAGV